MNRISKMVAITFAFAVSACAPGNDISVDLDYSQIGGLGYRNTSILAPGTTYLWNTQTNTIDKVAELTLTSNGTQPEKSNIEATRFFGLGIEGSLPDGVGRSAIEAAVSSRATFTADQAYRDKHSSVWTALSNYYRDETLKGRDVEADWRTRETQNGQPYLLVVVKDIIRTDNARTQLGGGGEGGSSASISVALAGSETVNLSLKNLNSQACSGNSAPCFFDVEVYQTFYQDNGNLNYRSANNVNRAGLSDAFRKHF